MHTYTHTYVHTYTHTYAHTYIHTHTHTHTLSAVRTHVHTTYFLLQRADASRCPIKYAYSCRTTVTQLYGTPAALTGGFHDFSQCVQTNSGIVQRFSCFLPNRFLLGIYQWRCHLTTICLSVFWFTASFSGNQLSHEIVRNLHYASTVELPDYRSLRCPVFTVITVIIGSTRYGRTLHHASTQFSAATDTWAVIRHLWIFSLRVTAVVGLLLSDLVKWHGYLCRWLMHKCMWMGRPFYKTKDRDT